MRVVRSWLAEYCDLKRLSDERLGDVMTSLGMQVESMEVVGTPVAGVVVAKVLRTERHADAAKVHRVWVDAGDGIERHVWCGAFNMKGGDLVPLATLGTKMPDGREILRRGILGIDSEGMLCSAAELGLSSDAAGIMILPATARLGRNVFDALGVKRDVVYDLDITRNRPDATGHLGVARDVAAHLGTKFVPLKGDAAKKGPPRRVPVKIVDERACARFNVTVMSGIVVGPSPDHLARRVIAAGMRPINNVVDASNLVMLETNQPNHAYDAEKVSSGFRIRKATAGETLTTLDGAQREFDVADLLICDGDDRAIGIAGVMGGANTEISDATTAVALETAWFEPNGVRLTSQRLALRTEASARFERGVDPLGVDYSVTRFAALLRQSCPKLVVHAGATDARTRHLPEQPVVTLRVAQVNRVLGTNLSAKDVATKLGRIGFVCTPKKIAAKKGSAVAAGAGFSVKVPSWRPDCVDEIDLVEEVARHVGYDALGKRVSQSTQPGGLSPLQQRRRALRDLVLSFGASEAMPNPFLAPGDHERAGVALEAAALELENPLVVEESLLRTSLRPGMLKAVGFNVSHRAGDISLYELGHVYRAHAADGAAHDLPNETEQLCIMAVGVDASVAVDWWSQITAVFGVGAQLDKSRVPSGYHATRSATLARGKHIVGYVGEIDRQVLTKYGIEDRVACLEVDASVLLGESPKVPTAKPVSRFPSSDFDLAFAAPTKVTAAAVQRAVKQATGALGEDVVLFDVFRKAATDESRSLAYRVRLRAADRTLTDAEVASTRAACIAAAEKLGCTLRG
ncbi:MAG: phenylalanine--tRNA ligase subunit beta [Actinomycetota bacterium]